MEKYILDNCIKEEIKAIENEFKLGTDLYIFNIEETLEYYSIEESNENINYILENMIIKINLSDYSFKCMDISDVELLMFDENINFNANVYDVNNLYPSYNKIKLNSYYGKFNKGE